MAHPLLLVNENCFVSQPCQNCDARVKELSQIVLRLVPCVRDGLMITTVKIHSCTT